MGISKTITYSEQEIRLAKYVKALAHPARMAILNLLLQKKACVCGDIVDELPLSQSTVSQHLKELKEVGLIKGDIEGVSVCYCINTVVWNEISEQLGIFFNQLRVQDSTCC
ncbi:ArsR/SmtB family transcription factor [Aquirufa antheringensis]|jgi:ArsR family transcriptional regulator|uniref:ArsR family transcriptional regulator n=1 Tax=Aquirufa antheringensis TaxID=2516559 RepID=A0A4Q9BHD8_9BACT|nr:metalloregulator ArsR/SmtB family transcription factor [Aquirufa antheringensis]MCZ2484935.1 winged helix-turn-helix transcriptional regulator [Aquirufa antheringensis]TBH75241.1 ArsR family transcriptional regulator [Aquirufa antheringensis]